MGYVMNVDLIPSEERGETKIDWLLSKHTYSFGRYYNLKRLNFGTLRVFNDDVIQPTKGFGTHPHDNMEIITIVLSGALAHKDSKGNHGILKPGDVQRMTAGTGIQHSEYNASESDPLHLLQIWVYPETRNLQPGYEQKTFSEESFQNNLQKIVSNSQEQPHLYIHQDAEFFLGHFDASKDITHKVKSRKHGDYVFVIDGKISIGDQELRRGDSAQITDMDTLQIHTIEPSKILVIEVGVNTL